MTVMLMTNTVIMVIIKTRMMKLIPMIMMMKMTMTKKTMMMTVTITNKTIILMIQNYKFAASSVGI